MAKLTLQDVPIEELVTCLHFDLSPYGIDAWCSTTGLDNKLAIHKRTGLNEERLSIQLDIPVYQVKHPEKYEATKFGFFAVREYTKREAHTEERVSLPLFKKMFIEACLKLNKH
jgi:hypothetical protein